MSAQPFPSTRAPATIANLRVVNRSPYPRGGHVVVPWSLESDGALEVVIGNATVPAQVDVTEGRSGPRTLTFTVPALPPGSHEAVVRPRTSDLDWSFPAAGPRAGGVFMVNHQLDLWFSLSECHGDLHCFAGAAATVQIDRFEFLDTEHANKNRYSNHDPEKRAMQIDYVRISRPPWDHYEPTCCVYPVFNKQWELLAFGAGPVRAWATIASSPFTFDFAPEPGTRRRQYECRLIRTLSLYTGADYVLEDLRVRGTSADDAARSVGLAFAVQYYLSADFSLDPEIIHYAQIPDWFGIGANWSIPRMPGYGFGTDAHVTIVRNPPPGFPLGEHAEHKAFSWVTEAAPRIRSFHVFRFDTEPDRIADDAGKLWYIHLLEPLRGAVEDGKESG